MMRLSLTAVLLLALALTVPPAVTALRGDDGERVLTIDHYVQVRSWNMTEMRS